MSPVRPLAANVDRFLATIEESGRIGVGREGGLRRLTLTDEDREVRDLFAGWCREAGLALTVDALGNMFGRRAGRSDLPPVLLGSHLDSQENGGRFDGVVGVLGALEVVRRLDELGVETERPLEIVNWTNEEGSRFSPPMLASGVFAGAYDLDWAYDRRAEDGARLGDELERIGYKGAAPVGGRALDSYFELHIEQGDVLDTKRKQVGVVTHGYSSHGVLVEYRGETAHTGPWPMEKRRNALVAAARLLVATDDIGWEHAATGGKATAARVSAWPNRAGLLSDWAEAVCDVRHEDPAVALAMREQLLAAVEAAARKANCDARVLDSWSWGGRIFDDTLVGLVRDTAAALGYSSLDLPTQAGHDAYFLARSCPSTMIFTPCKDGITHNNREFASAEDLEPGLNVLLNAVVARAGRVG